jgi:hypothetical protein
VNISVHLGNVAVPNRLSPDDSEPNKLRLDYRVRFWDSYLITAPVPEVVPSEQGARLKVPWTLLPKSVVETVDQLDPSFAKSVESWLQLKESPGEWNFERLEYMTVPQESKYYHVTGIRRIYAVNMFEFVEELGVEYTRNLSRAISSAVKEVIEESGRRGDQRLAFPALAAAEHVRDRHLVVSYGTSFSSILDGLSRADVTPSEVVLVVWHRLSGTPEMSSAIQGISAALYEHASSWSERFRLVATAAVVSAFLFGVLYGLLGIKKKRPRDWYAFVLRMLALIPIVGTYWYVDTFLKLMPISSWPTLEIGLIASFCFGIGLLIQNKTSIFEPKSRSQE